MIRDATHQTNLAHAHASKQLDMLLTWVPFGIVFLDRDLRFLRINEQLAKMNGQSVAAHLGKTVAEIIPAREATLREVTARVLANGQPVLNHEFTGETASMSGVTHTWCENWYPVRGDGGEIIGFGAVVEDVSERRQAEEVLRLKNERFELAVKASQAVLFQQDLDLRFTWLHNSAPGIDGSNAVGKREADLLERVEDVAVIEGLKREVIRSGVGMKREFFPQILGVVHCFEVIMEPLRNATGNITGLTGAAIDITERKCAEAAQRATEQHYRALAEASLEIPYRMSADWSTMLPLDGRGLFESSDSPLMHWAWVDRYLPRDEHVRVRQTVNDAIAQKKLFEMEHRVLRPDGSTGWGHSRAVPILDENQGVVAWFGVVSDITERKRIELRLTEATAIAEKANRAKSDFLSSMSHELRTPLNAILGFAQLLESEAPLPTPAQQRNLEQILKGGWYLLELISELLDLAQIETNELPLTIGPVSFADVMLECQAMIEPHAHKRAITVILPSFEHLGLLHADRTRVKQIMINLLTNAIKYNKAQGTLTVEVASRSADVIRVSVRDTGDGLASEELAQLFQPFKRLGKEASREEGTGIGLALSKRLVELMGGSIGVDSAVGVGSVFWFELKLASALQG